MAVKTVAEDGRRGDGLGLAKSGSASTHQHAESPHLPNKQPTKQASEMTTTYIDATLAWKSATLLGSIPESIREQPRSCIAHHHKLVALPQTSFWPSNAR